MVTGVDGSRAWCLPSDVDAAAVFASQKLRGCYGLKPVTQTQDYTCGAAAVATVLHWFDLYATEAMCAQAMGTNRVVGTTWLDILKYLRHRGLKAHAWARFDVDELKRRSDNQLPTLVEWLDWGGHWVVHSGYEPSMNALVFADPARARSRFCCHSVQSFEKHWVAPAAKDLPRTPAVAITIDLWGSSDGGKKLREKPYSKRSLSNWQELLMDWPTKRNWATVHREMTRGQE